MSSTDPFLGILIVMYIIIGAISLAATAFWIWAIVDCVNNEPREGNDKIIWILIIVLVHFIGALIYTLVRRPQRKAIYGR